LGIENAAAISGMEIAADPFCQPALCRPEQQRSKVNLIPAGRLQAAVSRDEFRAHKKPAARGG
jgi:hypothetical protein